MPSLSDRRNDCLARARAIADGYASACRDLAEAQAARRLAVASERVREADAAIEAAAGRMEARTREFNEARPDAIALRIVEEVDRLRDAANRDCQDRLKAGRRRAS